MKWPLTFYTNKTLDDWMGGATRGPVIVLRPEYKDDEGIYQHELTHVKQWFFSLGTLGLFYMLSKWCRARIEAQAYAKQTHYPDGKGGQLTVERAAYRMAKPGYKLGLTQEQCLDLILDAGGRELTAAA